MDGEKPSEWFQKRLQSWQKDLQEWHRRHTEFKDPTKRAVAVLMGPTMSKSAGPPPGGALSKAKAQAPGGAEPKAQPEQKDDSKDDKKKDSKGEQEKDLLQKLLDEMEREDQDIFGIDDVCASKEGAPLFCNFTFEDWALLSLRFELHLLLHAVRREAGDKGGISPRDLASQYTKYYKKSLDPKNYGAESVEDIIELVKDTAIIGMRSKVVEPMVSHDLESNGIFVKLTEDNRRDRKRKIDAGEESAQLKFPRPNAPQANTGTVAKGVPVSGAPMSSIPVPGAPNSALPFSVENPLTTAKAGGAVSDSFATTPKAKGPPPGPPPGGPPTKGPPPKGPPPAPPKAEAGGWSNSGGWGNSGSTPSDDTSASTPKDENGGWNNSGSWGKWQDWGSDNSWKRDDRNQGWSSPSKGDAGDWSKPKADSGDWSKPKADSGDWSKPKADSSSWGSAWGPKPVSAGADGQGAHDQNRVHSCGQISNKW